MANTLLTPSQITNQALAVLHQKCNFIGSINRAYDSSFSVEGAKIGSDLRIRLPNRYVVTSGPALATAGLDTNETQVTLSVTSQKHVDMKFTSTDLTMAIQDFSARFIEPAMAALAANIEADAFSMALDVYSQVNGQGAPQTFKNILQARKLLIDSLAPAGDWAVRMNTQDNVDLVDTLKGLFQSSQNIAAQYRDGVLGQTAGFEFAENTLINSFTRGAEAGYAINGAGQTGTSIVVGTGTGAGNRGDVFTIAGVFRVHPETKASTGVLHQFVLSADYGGGAGTMQISPAIVTAGPYQNVTAAPANSALLVFAGAAGVASGMSLAYCKDAFTFATADLILPQGVDMAARKTMDGISMRLLRQYDINSDAMPTRLDVLYGYKTLRPQLAARLAAN